KSFTADTVLNRRYISHDKVNLKQYPEKAYIDNNSAINRFLEDLNSRSYYSKG
ncbi:hypothetical protein SODALDRAFT_275430, partial [Sodiomyces alkalinus F11]